jgi:hypothetical protein
MRAALMSIDKAYMTYSEGMTHAAQASSLEVSER